MHLEFLLEEESVQIALENLLPKILPKNITYDFHVFQGKDDLIKKLPLRLKGYRHWLPLNWRIIILLDSDGGDCLILKAKLQKIANQAGFLTLSEVGPNGQFQVINRLAVQELEAWFFGDFTALRHTYPRIPAGLMRHKKYRNPDNIVNTWETLERIMQRAGYYSGGLPKKEVARRIAAEMDPQHNRSKSFQVFRDTLRKICPPDMNGDI